MRNGWLGAMPGLGRWNRLHVYKKKTVDGGTAARSANFKWYSDHQITPSHTDDYNQSKYAVKAVRQGKLVIADGNFNS